MSSEASPGLNAKWALVTGGSRGIGLATAQALARAGSRIIAISRRGVAGAAGLERAVDIRADLTDKAALERAIASTLEATAGGGPDILVNNAGTFAIASVADADTTAFDRMLDINLAVPFKLVRAVLPRMLERKSGHIVGIGSVADHVLFAGNAAYSSSKYGLRALHEILRLETRGSGVRVTLVAPAATDTDIVDSLDPRARSMMPPASMMLRADSVADAVLWAVTRPPAVDVEEVRLSFS